MKKIVICITLVVLLIISVYGGILTVSYFKSLPNLDKTNYLEIYDRNNKLIYSDIKGKQTKYINLFY